MSNNAIQEENLDNSMHNKANTPSADNEKSPILYPPREQFHMAPPHRAPLGSVVAPGFVR